MGAERPLRARDRAPRLEARPGSLAGPKPARARGLRLRRAPARGRSRWRRCSSPSRWRCSSARLRSGSACASFASIARAIPLGLALGAAQLVHGCRALDRGGGRHRARRRAPVAAARGRARARGRDPAAVVCPPAADLQRPRAVSAPRDARRHARRCRGRQGEADLRAASRSVLRQSRPARRRPHGPTGRTSRTLRSRRPTASSGATTSRTGPGDTPGPGRRPTRTQRAQLEDPVARRACCRRSLPSSAGWRCFSGRGEARRGSRSRCCRCSACSATPTSRSPTRPPTAMS